MPLSQFWFLHKQTDRLRAEEDLRVLKVLTAVNSQELYQKTVEQLNKSLGELATFKPLPVDTDPTKQDPGFDRAGLQALKAKISGL